VIRRRAVAAYAFLCLSSAAIACTQDTHNDTAVQEKGTNRAVVTTGENLAIEFRSEPDPARAGENTFEVTLRRRDGSPVTDAAVEVVCSMPPMPAMNMPAMHTTTTLVHQTGGRYRGVATLSMGGTWNVSMTVTQGNQELGSGKLSIVVR
jgi:hypothetical protein